MLINPTAWQGAANRLQLSGFVLDLNRGELLTPDDRLAGLRKQALDVLLVLGERAGQVVTKDELMSRVWPDVVVGEGSLVQAIGDIRRVLGDTGHRLIRNVARRGYMLVPEEPSTPQIFASDAITAPPLTPEQATATCLAPEPAPATRRTRPHWLVLVVIITVLGIVGVSVIFSRFEQRAENATSGESAAAARHPAGFAGDVAVCRRGCVRQR